MSEERQIFYEAARTEIVQRLGLRDQLLVAYIATIGAYFAFVMDKQLNSAPSQASMLRESLSAIALPIICFVFSYIILQHHTVIAQIARHIRNELYPYKTKGPNHWDSSRLVDSSVNPLKAREMAQGAILLLPGSFLIVYVIRNFQLATAHTDAAFAFIGVVTADLVVLYLTARLHLRAYQTRSDLRR